MGLEIWRIEKFQVVKKAPSDPCYSGKFFAGDSYIILQTKKRENALERHIFFWLGKDTTQVGLCFVCLFVCLFVC